jgi:hypothetical protein
LYIFAVQRANELLCVVVYNALALKRGGGGTAAASRTGSVFETLAADDNENSADQPAGTSYIYVVMDTMFMLVPFPFLADGDVIVPATAGTDPWLCVAQHNFVPRFLCSYLCAVATSRFS